MFKSYDCTIRVSVDELSWWASIDDSVSEFPEYIDCPDIKLWYDFMQAHFDEFKDIQKISLMKKRTEAIIDAQNAREEKIDKAKKEYDNELNRIEKDYDEQLAKIESREELKID